MADDNSNFKISKPTLKPPSDMGKKIDGQFKSKMSNIGVNMNTIKEDEEQKGKEPSLKKKIFSLPKMETLVMTDEYLSNIFNKLKEDAQETYGYHWNETIMNIMFNEYILDDNAYLQKYKNTKTYNKKRRGQEGVEELEKNLQDKIDNQEPDEKPGFERDEKMADVETNKDNLDNFKKDLDNDKMKDSDNEVAEQMKKVLAEAEQVDELFGFGKPTAPMTTHKASKNDTYIVRKKDNTAVGVISPNQSSDQNQAAATNFADPNQYSKMPWYMAVQNGVKGVPAEVTDGQSGEFDTLQQKYSGVPALGENKEIGMTAGSGFELQYNTSTPAQAEKAANTDSTYQNETTTSASSGAYVGPFPGKRKPVLDKPLWHGGTILKEGVDYITDGAAFKSYVSLVESVDTLQEMIDETVDEGSGISIKQHAENILKQLDRMRTENPELNELPEFTELLDIYNNRAQSSQVPTSNVRTPVPTADSNNQWKVNETPSFNGAMEKDLKNTGRGVEDESTENLESKDGLFKGKWNENKLNENAPEQSATAPEQQGNVAQPDAQGGDDIFTKIGGLVYPDNDKQPTELGSIGKRFVTDFADVFRGMSPDKIYQLLDRAAQARNVKESMMDDQPDSMARTMDSPELNTAGSGGASSSSTPPVTENGFDTQVDTASNQGDRQDKEAIADSSKFREFLRSKYGVESVADLAPAQKRQIMKDLAVSGGVPSASVEPEVKTKPELDLKNFRATDAQKAEYLGRDNKQLDFLAKNNAAINSLADYLALEKQYAVETGEKLFHPMAILASIQALPAEKRMSLSNVEKALTAKLKGGIEETAKKTNTIMKEERQTPSQLNLQNIKKETAKLTQKDMASADALKQAKVYPNPDEFYIEQDDAKVQDFKTGEELEAEALKTMEEKRALQNAGNSTDDNGKEITKRNLTKEEMLKLAMDRGDGMHNIVYDNKPSERFEKRLEKDMGEDQYKLRQEKMKYREDAPMYNKDTQPTEKGDEKFQDDKFKVGFNEAFTGKFTDDFGKSKLVEFMMSSVEEVSSVNEGYKLTLDGLGNKYTVKINENEVYANSNKFDFYLVEGNKVVKVKAGQVKPEVITESEMEKKMRHLMGYNSNDFVNTKKSIKF